MRRLPLPTATSLTLLVALMTPRTAVPQTHFPEPDKLPPHPELPDPLVMFNGERVTSKQQWFDQRRPELKELFQHYMYGYLLPPRKIAAKVLHEDAKAFGGKATLREVAISFGPADTPPIHLLLVIPNERKGPAPVFAGLNFCGNHALVNDPGVRLPTVWMYDNQPGVKKNRATETGRGKQIDVWALEQSIDRGYAVATFYNGDVGPDRKDVREGIQPHLLTKDHKPRPDDGGTVAPGPGAFIASSITCARTRTSTKSGSPRSVIRGWARQCCWPRRWMSASPWPSHTRPAAAALPPVVNTIPRPNPSSASTPASPTGSTASSSSSTTSRNDYHSIRIASSPSSHRGRCCSPTPSRTSGPIRRASSTCCGRPIRSTVFSASPAWRRSACQSRVS